MESSKRSRRSLYEESADQLQSAILKGLSHNGSPAQLGEAVFKQAIGTPILKQDLQAGGEWGVRQQQLLHFGLRRTLQSLTSQALSAQQPLMKYRLEAGSEPAVKQLLLAAIGLTPTKYIQTSDVFQLFEDIVETADIEEVKIAFRYLHQHMDIMQEQIAMQSHLNAQKACNMFTKRLSNDQDAEFLGIVLTLVAKILPFNSKAGINTVFAVNQHPVHMDDAIEPSVDGKEPVDEALYRHVWGLQSAFQDPVKQIDPEHWAKTLSSIQSVLSKLRKDQVGVASTTTAVSQENGQSVIVKYLTSSKLTLLQLGDAAFRRTLLVQCLVLLHACAHPRLIAGKPVAELKPKQVQELVQLQKQLYEQLSNTPEQGPAFTDVLKTILDRETAFVTWKSTGAPEYWEKTGKGLPSVNDAALIRALPNKRQKLTPRGDVMDEPPAAKSDTDVGRMWSNDFAEDSLYRKKRDSVLLPTMDQHFARIGEEIKPEARRKNMYATSQGIHGVDPLYLFRCQRMLQRADMGIWERTTQLDKAGERLELAFADLYPESVPAEWKRPEIAVKSPAQNAVRKPPTKPAASAATSAAEDAGDKQAVEGNMAQADTAASPSPAKAAGQQTEEAKAALKAEPDQQPAGDVSMADSAEPDSGTAGGAATLSSDPAGLATASKLDPAADAPTLPNEGAQPDSTAPAELSLAAWRDSSQQLGSHEPAGQPNIAAKAGSREQAAVLPDAAAELPQGDAPNLHSSAADKFGAEVPDKSKEAKADPVASQVPEAQL